jgi:flagellar biosynthetic protein FlhB
VAEGPEKEAKTEPATPRRRSEARKNGQVAISTEFVSALMLITGFATLIFAGHLVMRSTGELTIKTIQTMGELGREELDVAGSTVLLKGIFLGALTPLCTVFLPGLLIGLVAGYGQVGFMITPKAVEMDPSKVSPIAGFGKLFSTRSVVRTALSGAKMFAIGSVMGLIAFFQLENLARVSDSDLGPLLVALGQVAVKTTVGGLGAILVLALIDFFYQRFQYEKDMRMSKQEIKEENRISEGDPHIKAKIRQVQRDMAFRRMMSDVPKATVVVTNPTHYAVALRYERADGDEAGGAIAAPRCIAKGKGPVARRIKALARENGVVLYEDVPLARALFAQVQVGQEIPEELYAAVAEVLAYVYRLEGRLEGRSKERAAGV